MQSQFSNIEQELIDDFALFDDPMDKYEHLIDLGNELPPLAEAHKIDNNLVKGCQSKVWLVAQPQDHKILFQADSNTLITKGVVAILIKVLSGKIPQQILDYDFALLEKIGLKEMLSSQRANGLQAMINKMQAIAKHHLKK